MKINKTLARSSKWTPTFNNRGPMDPCISNSRFIIITEGTSTNQDVKGGKGGGGSGKAIPIKYMYF